MVFINEYILRKDLTLNWHSSLIDARIPEQVSFENIMLNHNRNEWLDGIQILGNRRNTISTISGSLKQFCAHPSFVIYTVFKFLFHQIIFKELLETFSNSSIHKICVLKKLLWSFGADNTKISKLFIETDFNSSK